jgi:hypothetical protein
MLDTTKNYEITEYHVDSKTSLGAVEQMAKLQKITGELTVRFEAGGVRTIMFVQKTIVTKTTSQ